jgi:hypothetical protein
MFVCTFSAVVTPFSPFTRDRVYSTFPTASTTLSRWAVTSLRNFHLFRLSTPQLKGEEDIGGTAYSIRTETQPRCQLRPRQLSCCHWRMDAVLGGGEEQLHGNDCRLLQGALQHERQQEQRMATSSAMILSTCKLTSLRCVCSPLSPAVYFTTDRSRK